MKKWLLAIFVVISIPVFSQSWNRDSIIRELRKELKDTNFSELTAQMIFKLEKSKKDTLALFPFVPFDSILLHILEPWEPSKKQGIVSSKRLDSLQVKNLIILCNNPLYYDWGECGTPIPEAKAYFYLDGMEVATVKFACGLGQVGCSPDNIFTRFGMLKSEADTIINSVGF